MKTILFSTLLWSLGLFFSVGFGQELTADEKHNGMVKIEKGFQIFPEGRLGNSLYKGNQWMFSKSNLILKGVAETLGGYVYYGVNSGGEKILEYEGEEGNRFVELEGSFFQLITQSGLRKIFRVDGNDRIYDILPRSKTANGLTLNSSGDAAFFHIASGKSVTRDDGSSAYRIGFKLHVLKKDTEKERVVGPIVIDYSTRLKLSWVDQNTLQYTLSDGTSATIQVP